MGSPIATNDTDRIQSSDHFRATAARDGAPPWVAELLAGWYPLDDRFRDALGKVKAVQVARRAAIGERDAAQAEMARAVHVVRAELDAKAAEAVFPEGNIGSQTAGPPAAAALAATQSAELARAQGVSDPLCDTLAEKAAALQLAVRDAAVAASDEHEARAVLVAARDEWDRAWRHIARRILAEVGRDRLDDWLLIYANEDEPSESAEQPSVPEAEGADEDESDDDTVGRQEGVTSEAA